MVAGVNKIFGYARVSTKDQNLDSQVDALREAGAEKIYTEKMTGTVKDRPEFNKMIQQLRKGDKVIIYDLSRMGRNLKNLLEIAEEFKKIGADLKILKFMGDESVDTSTAQGALMFSLFGAISQYQRDQIAEKTRAGLESARARGRKGGRKRKDPKLVEKALKLYDSQEYSITEIEEMTGISRPTLYRYIKERKGGVSGESWFNGYYRSL